MYVYIAEAKTVGKEISIRGWIHRKREVGGAIFIIIRDRTGIIQAAIKKGVVDENSWKEASSVSIESSIKIIGTLKEDKRSPSGFEIEVKKLQIISMSEPYPITEYQSPELLLDKRHLWLRSTKMISIMKIRAHIFKYTRNFLDKDGFYEISPPLITKAGGETGAEMFELKYFDQKAYLTETSQMYSEAMTYSLGKVYSLAPSFRAEKSRTTKHLAEYWHLEPEMAHYDMDDNMQLQEKLVSHIAQMLVKENGDILEELKIDKSSLNIIRPPFKRITYEQAIEKLNNKGKNLKWGDDFGVEEEHLLTRKRINLYLYYIGQEN